ncbi:MAG: multicopper oxidase family protein [Propionibacteriales bacterium]|nr:multicopper oxidase family protein [Propionibacteriales bacterium]
MSAITRRNLIRGAAGFGGVVALGGLTGCGKSDSLVGPNAGAVAKAEAVRLRSAGSLVHARLSARPATIDLGGRSVATWAYGDSVPGPLLRATAGDTLRVDVANDLASAETSVHWHGIALRNDMDGVPGITQDPIAAGESFRYEFVVPDPGTYFYHPHTGVQLDRGLYGVLVVDDPSEPGGYDDEWVVVLDDWVDGTGRSPDDMLKQLQAVTGSSSDGMGGMDMGGMGSEMQSPILGGAGDISYPHYLVNGRTPQAPVTLTGKPGQRVRIRLVNAGSDTAFRVALGGHRLTITHSDGFPVKPAETDALMIGMGERFDITVTLDDGVFPLVASAEGKSGQGLALVRTGAGRVPAATARPAELSGAILLGSDLDPTESSRLAQRGVDRRHTLVLAGSMAPYRWTVNGKTFPDSGPLPVNQGERVRLRFSNHSMMFHPMHLHGHTFAVVDGGARKDTVIVRPMQSLDVDLDADNPGQWAAHCHNIYHAESGMMTILSYRSPD